MNTSYQIEKLGAENYGTWSVQMKSVLVQCDYWAIVSGQENKPDDEKKTELAAWENKDAKALAMIVLGLKPSEVINVKHCVTANDAWLKLKQIYQPAGPSRKASLFKQIVQLRLRDGIPMIGHITNFFTIVENLREIDVNLPEDLAVIMLLCTLPEPYDNFVVAVESRDQLPSLATLKSKLLVEEQRQKERETKDVIKEQAFAVSSKNERAGINRQMNNNQRENYVQFRGKCYKCGRRGHKATQCRSKDKKSKVATSLFHLEGSGCLQTNEWCLDSGATCHMCCDRNMFTTIDESVKQPIDLAAKITLSSKGTRTVRINASKGHIILNNVLFVPELRGNFVSINRITNSDHSVEFKRGIALIRNKNREVVMTATQRNDLFVVNLKAEAVSLLNMEKERKGDLIKWHKRYGHLNIDSLSKLNKLAVGIRLNKESVSLDCKICVIAKICRKSFPKTSRQESKNVLDLIHSDICGPIESNVCRGFTIFCNLY